MSEQVFVRHGSAGNRERWKDDDRLRPLSKKGRRQAEALVQSLAGIAFRRVLSSPYIRCVQTVEPLARAHGLAVEKTDALAEGAGLEAALGLVRDLTGLSAAHCTHGDIMYELCEELVRKGLIRRGDVRYEKGSAWILEENAGELVSARYMPAPKA